MKLSDLTRHLPQLDRMFPPAQPTLAVAIDEERLVFARVGGSRSAPKLLGFFAQELPPGTVSTSTLGPNIPEPAALSAALKAARAAVAPSGGPIALALPDPVVRIAVIGTAELPGGRAEQREMIGWRLKKMLPYRLEDAQVDSQAFAGAAGRHVVVAAAARRKIVAEYETALTDHGFQPGTVTVSTLALADLLPQRLGGDVMLLHVSSGWFSMLVTDGREPVFFRSKILPENERGGSARDEAVLAEIAPSLEYHGARLGRPPIARVILHGAVPGCDELIDRLAGILPAPPLRLNSAMLAQAPAPVADALATAMALACRGLGEPPATSASNNGSGPAARAGGTEAA